MNDIAHLKHMNIGNSFRAYLLMAEPIDPFLGVDHTWMSGPCWPVLFHAVRYYHEKHLSTQ